MTIRKVKPGDPVPEIAFRGKQNKDILAAAEKARGDWVPIKFDPPRKPSTVYALCSRIRSGKGVYKGTGLEAAVLKGILYVRTGA